MGSVQYSCSKKETNGNPIHVWGLHCTYGVSRIYLGSPLHAGNPIINLGSPPQIWELHDNLGSPSHIWKPHCTSGNPTAHLGSPLFAGVSICIWSSHCMIWKPHLQVGSPLHLLIFLFPGSWYCSDLTTMMYTVVEYLSMLSNM